METFFDNISYFHRFLSIFWIFWYFLVTKKLMTSAYNRWCQHFFHFQRNLNIFFNNCKGRQGWRGGEGALGANLRKNSEKTTLKKPSLIRVKSHGFYRSLPLKNFISFSLRKTFSLNLLLKSDFKRCLG